MSLVNNFTLKILFLKWYILLAEYIRFSEDIHSQTLSFLLEITSEF